MAPPPPGISVRPVAIDYRQVDDIAWFGGERGLANALRVLGLPSRKVTVRLLDPLPPTTDRKALARGAAAAIANALSSVAADPALQAARP